MAEIRFARGAHGTPTATAGDPRLRPLVSQLTSDIQTYAPDCVDLLQCIDDVASGRSPQEEYEGNSAVLRCTRDGVTVHSRGPVASSAAYSAEQARTVILAYLTHLAPSAEERLRHVTTWEREHGRPCTVRHLLDLPG